MFVSVMTAITLFFLMGGYAHALKELKLVYGEWRSSSSISSPVVVPFSSSIPGKNSEAEITSSPKVVHDINTTLPSPSFWGVDVAWINLEHSTARRKYMEEQLQFYGVRNGLRVTAVTPKDVHIPSRLALPHDCLAMTKDEIKEMKSLKTIKHLFRHNKTDAYVSAYPIIISEHCGRKKNTKRELAVTLSHLKALYAAVSISSSNPVVLMLEDDMSIPYEIDFPRLLSVVPQPFSVIQLVTTNERDALDAWTIYKNTGSLFTPRDEQDMWCAGAYLVNKTAVRHVLQGLISSWENGLYQYRIVAGYTRPCWPKYCCSPQGEFLLTSPSSCIHAPRGFQADHFVFRLVPFGMYLMNVPIVTAGRLGNSSTIHQKHVGSHHTAAFHRINSYIMDMKLGTTVAPSFIHFNVSYAAP